ncbi:MAG: hypothetical protein ABII71_01550 [Candidatus Micrarchaeota archaeon]
MAGKQRQLKKGEIKDTFERKSPGKLKRFLAAAATTALCTFTTPHLPSLTNPIGDNVAHAEEARTAPEEPAPTPQPGQPGSGTVARPPPGHGPETSAEPAPAAEGQREAPDFNNDFDLGVRTDTTESGASSFSVTAAYGQWGSISTGVMWFPSIANGELGFAPFGTLRITPGFQRSGVIGRSYTAIGGTMLNSEMFAFQGFGLGFVRKTGDFELRGAATAMGALAYPRFDLISLEFNLGASLNWREMITVYGALNFFFAADSAAQTAYVGFYEPRFQSLDIGIEIAIRDWLLDISGSYDVIRSGAQVGIERQFFSNGGMIGTVGASLGFANWSDRLAGRRWELVALANVEFRFPGRHINSTNGMGFEHLHGGGVSQAEIDADNPYINRTFIDERAREVEQDLQGARSMDDFSGRYSGRSFEELIWAARIITHRANYLYSYAANEAIGGMRFFDPEVQRIANMDYDTSLAYMGAYLRFLDTHLTLNGLPEHLRLGIGMCPMIHDFGARFLRLNGIRAITASVNTTTEPHMILIAMDDNNTVLVDYGDEYRTGPYSFDEVLRLYGMSRGAMVLRTQLFDDGYIGTFTTSEGRIVIRAMGFDGRTVLFRDFLNLRSRRH